MTGKEQQECEGYDGTGKTSDHDVETVCKICARSGIGGVCLGIVIVCLVGSIKTDHNIIIIAVIRIIL